MTYVFKWKRGLYTHKKVVIGHEWIKDQDKFLLTLPDGSYFEIAEWHLCAIRLGVDFVLYKKKVMEEQAGQPVQLSGAIGQK